MFVKLECDKMRTLDGGALIVAACDTLSASGVDNFINWHDEISVLIDDVPYNVVVDYAAGGVRFVHPDRTEYNE